MKQPYTSPQTLFCDVEVVCNICSISDPQRVFHRTGIKGGNEDILIDGSQPMPGFGGDNLGGDGMND